nr:unnamed protein product [Callosobruchus chinensis]
MAVVKRNAMETDAGARGSSDQLFIKPPYYVF